MGGVNYTLHRRLPTYFFPPALSALPPSFSIFVEHLYRASRSMLNPLPKTPFTRRGGLRERDPVHHASSANGLNLDSEILCSAQIYGPFVSKCFVLPSMARGLRPISHSTRHSSTLLSVGLLKEIMRSPLSALVSLIALF